MSWWTWYASGKQSFVRMGWSVLSAAVKVELLGINSCTVLGELVWWLLQFSV